MYVVHVLVGFPVLAHGKSDRGQCSTCRSSGGTVPASLPSRSHEDSQARLLSHARINFGSLIE